MSDSRTVRELLSDPNRWTKHVVARDPKGEPVNPFHPTACQFCMAGACQRLSGGDIDKYRALLDRICFAAREFFPYRVIDSDIITELNDDPTVSHADILNIIRYACV